MQGEITVVPAPKRVKRGRGALRFCGFAAGDKLALAPHTRRKLEGYECADGVPLGVRIARVADSDEGYELEISAKGVMLTGATPRALHYAVLTLLQIADGCGGALPYATVTDAPDFAARGIMYDISRNRVPTLDTLKHAADILSDLKLNMLQLYVEGRSFYYASKAEFYDDPEDFLTPSDVAELKEYCAQRFVELVPCGNSLGHMIYWLNQPQFGRLSYSPDGFEWWEDGLHAPPGTLDPNNPDSKRFVYSLFDELLAPYGDARLFNIGGDEPFDMQFGKRAIEDGGATYFGYMRDVCDNVRARGLTPMLWGDVAHKHPDKLDLLGDAIYLEWRYEAGEFCDNACKTYAERGARFYVCPSSSLCGNFTGKTDNMLANMREAARYGKKHGAEGFLNTEWGDGGSAQSFVSSVYGFAAAGACAWNGDGFDGEAVERWLDARVYLNPIAATVADLGRYVNCQEQPVKGLPFLFSALYVRQTDGINRDRNNYSDPAAFFWRDELLTKRECDKTAAFLDGVRARFERTEKDENNIYVRETRYCLDVLDWALAHMRLCLDLKNLRDTPEQIRAVLALGEKCVAQREALWFERNKKSDYALSSYRYKALLKKYESLLD